MKGNLLDVGIDRYFSINYGGTCLIESNCDRGGLPKQASSFGDRRAQLQHGRPLQASAANQYQGIMDARL
jgi:hypothetical protein